MHDACLIRVGVNWNFQVTTPHDFVREAGHNIPSPSAMPACRAEMSAGKGTEIPQKPAQTGSQPSLNEPGQAKQPPESTPATRTSQAPEGNPTRGSMDCAPLLSQLVGFAGCCDLEHPCRVLQGSHAGWLRQAFLSLTTMEYSVRRTALCFDGIA